MRLRTPRDAALETLPDGAKLFTRELLVVMPRTQVFIKVRLTAIRKHTEILDLVPVVVLPLLIPVGFIFTLRPHIVVIRPMLLT